MINVKDKKSSKVDADHEAERTRKRNQMYAKVDR